MNALHPKNEHSPKWLVLGDFRWLVLDDCELAEKMKSPNGWFSMIVKPVN
jgi:hypothetical protein